MNILHCSLGNQGLAGLLTLQDALLALPFFYEDLDCTDFHLAVYVTWCLLRTIRCHLSISNLHLMPSEHRNYGGNDLHLMHRLP